MNQITFLSSFVIMAIVFLLAMGAAWIRFFASRALRITVDSLFLLMLIIPALLVMFCRNGAPLIIDIIEKSPYIYFFTIMGFRRVSRETIDAARIQGLSSCGVFWHLFLPAAWPWLLGGLVVNLEVIAKVIQLIRYAS